MPSRPHATRLASLVVVVAAISSGCSSTGEISDADGGLDQCPTTAVDPATCTSGFWGDCTWAEVLSHGSYCPACVGQIGDVAAAADCGGYHVLLRYGVDYLYHFYYDLNTGALVASGGGNCKPGPLPAGCEQATYETLPSWCEGYQADGTGTRCCRDAGEYPSWTPTSATCAASSDHQTGVCGDYHVETVPALKIRSGDTAAETSYYDQTSGTLIATIDTINGQTWCVAEPAGGAAAPTCTPAYLPMCAGASGPTN